MCTRNVARRKRRERKRKKEKGKGKGKEMLVMNDSHRLIRACCMTVDVGEAVGEGRGRGGDPYRHTGY